MTLKSEYLRAAAYCSFQRTPGSRGLPSRSTERSSTLLSTSRWSTSHTATMRSLPSSWAFSAPIPPAPTMAIARVSLGAWYPGPPSTWRGTTVAPIARAALPDTNSLRVILAIGLASVRVEVTV